MRARRDWVLHPASVATGQMVAATPAILRLLGRAQHTLRTSLTLGPQANGTATLMER
ncbi:hypothetical protein GGQ88_001907 [Novosphingobium hassiacum]|uniref:Uncharacterized protein n=1 Tax=Novosphingobium hassiacum TaxID=173676 RepID=A0A7W6EVX3_9SPHN|nr:hypothetical protein [Novosphingobium hassiacum]MBB3860641.1 hypothetical protein [Novosphingobium hassiacum]